MIVAPDWVWLHIPKCGGSSTERILNNAFCDDPAIQFDKDGKGHPVIWHHSISERMAHEAGFVLGDRRVVANIRRLPHWILSRVHFEVSRSKAGGLIDRERFIKGVFRERPLRPNSVGNLNNANDLIGGYANEVTDWIRTEKLSEDISWIFGISKNETHANRGRIEYIRHLALWFTKVELEQLYDQNPIWAEIEEKVYGNILRL